MTLKDIAKADFGKTEVDGEVYLLKSHKHCIVEVIR